MATSSANSSESSSIEGKESKALYDAVRSMLDEMADGNISVLIDAFKQLKINTVKELAEIADMVHEKAMENPVSARHCAEVCGVMQSCWNVDSEVSTAEVIENLKQVRTKPVLFRYLLLNKCQEYFEGLETHNIELAEKKNALTKPPNENELQLIQAQDNIYWKKYVNNVIFIGELFKRKMLTPKIILACVRKLMDQCEENLLECLCVLLTTTGEIIDTKLPKDLNLSFARLKEIKKAALNGRTPVISSRVCSMISNLIELRENKWVLKVVKE